MSVPIDIVCSECGGRNVRRDAYAAWDAETQEWELFAIYDQGYCEDCGRESRLAEVPIVSGAANRDNQDS